MRAGLGLHPKVGANLRRYSGDCGAAPLLGEHNAVVLAEVAGYSETRINALRDAGVIHEEAAVAEFRVRGEL